MPFTSFHTLLTLYAHLLYTPHILYITHQHQTTTTTAGGSYVSIPSYNPHTGLDNDGPASYAPSNGTPSNNYGTVLLPEGKVAEQDKKIANLETEKKEALDKVASLEKERNELKRQLDIIQSTFQK